MLILITNFVFFCRWFLKKGAELQEYLILHTLTWRNIKFFEFAKSTRIIWMMIQSVVMNANT